MGPTFTTRHQNSVRSAKRTIKFLSVCTNPLVRQQILRQASVSTVKGLCNALYNIAENPDIKVGRGLKRVLKQNRETVGDLISPKVAIKTKRKIVQTGGGLFLATVLPLILSTALSAIGSRFFPQK